MFFVGLDLGQAGDPTAVIVSELVTQPIVDHGGRVEDYVQYHHVRHAQRFPLNTSYPQIVKTVKGMMQTEALKGKCTLIADATGVGRPVIDMLRAAGVGVIPVMITGGAQESHDKDTGFWNVPKRNLVSALQILFGEGRLKFAAGLPEAEIIVKELLNFKIKVSAKGNDTYEAWREGDHDDYVLALAIAAWYANRFKPQPEKEDRKHPLTTMKEFRRW